MSLHAELDHPLLPPSTAVWSLQAVEELSRPFAVQLTFPSEDPDLPLDEFLATAAGVHLYDPERLMVPGGERFFHGTVTAARYLFPRGERFVYQLELRPRFQLLEHRSDTRIFQGMSALGIGQDVFRKAGLDEASFEWPQDEYQVREFCLQWRESDLAFVSRLLEDEGVYYWTEHQADGDFTRFADDVGAFGSIDGDPVITVTERPSPLVQIDWLAEATIEAKAAHDAYTARGWDLQHPVTPTEVPLGPQPALGERYEFRRTFDQDDAFTKEKARRRWVALRTRRFVLRGTTNSLRLVPGRTFDVGAAALVGVNQSWLVTRAVTRFASPEAAGGAATYRVAIEATPADVEHRPQLETPRPRLYGKQSAVVVGPPGEEIFVDDLGRIKVQFFWDREGTMDHNSSCWMRVQQQNLQSAMILPRIGWEVEVGFEEGEPDRPFVLNKLYNAQSMAPYGLPDALAQCSLQSSSSPGGGGTNEIRMDDSNGKQELFLHGQRDLAMRVGHVMTETVALKAELQVGSNVNETIQGNDVLTVGANQSVNVTGTLDAETLQTRQITIGGTDDLGVGALYTSKTAGPRTEQVGAARLVLASRITELFESAHERLVGGAQATTSAGPIAEAVKGRKSELVGGAKAVVTTKAHQESIGTGKALTAIGVQAKTGQGYGVTAGAAITTVTGGPMVIKCDKDFAITGSTVTITVGAADLQAGAKLKLATGSAQLDASVIQGDSVSIALKGVIEYK